MGKPASQTEETEMKNAIIFIIALAVSNLALAESPAQIHGKYAAPFGLEWGLSKEQVTAMGVKLTHVNPAGGVYGATILPKNLSDVKKYILCFHPRFGLICVSADTKLGTLKGKERSNQLKTALVNKYGKPSIDNEDFLGLGFTRTTFRWGSDIDGTIKLKLDKYPDEVVDMELTYRSAALHVAAERKRERESRQRKKQTVPDEDAL